MRHSISSIDPFLCWSIELMSFCQDLNLSSGRDTVISLVLICHPKTMAVSERVPSSANFDSERQSSRVVCSFGANGRQMVCIASAIALVPLIMLSFKSGTIVIPSSM